MYATIYNDMPNNTNICPTFICQAYQTNCKQNRPKPSQAHPKPAQNRQKSSKIYQNIIKSIQNHSKSKKYVFLRSVLWVPIIFSKQMVDFRTKNTLVTKLGAPVHVDRSGLLSGLIWLGRAMFLPSMLAPNSNWILSPDYGGKVR